MKIALKTILSFSIVVLNIQIILAQDSTINTICHSIVNGSDFEKLLLELKEDFSSEPEAEKREGIQLAKQSTARHMYQIHLTLLDSCKNYPLQVWPFYSYDVVDLENVFGPTQLDSLISHVKSILNKTKVYVTIGTISEYRPFRSIEPLAYEALGKWGVAKNDKPKILILLSVVNREIFIAHNTPAEKYLTPAEQKAFINICTADFKRGSYFSGLRKGLDFLCSRL